MKIGMYVWDPDLEDWVKWTGSVSEGGGSSSNSNPTAPSIFNLSAPSSGVEVSQALPAGTQKILIRSRGASQIQFSFSAGTSGTNFITIPAGAFYSQSGLSLSGKTLYLQTNLDNQTIEVLTWA